jgi:hypothetical protein
MKTRQIFLKKQNVGDEEQLPGSSERSGCDHKEAAQGAL